MFASLSVFLNFNLPNATTWFYFSFLLAVALFFKFARLVSMRNWDVVFLFLLTPGLLLIQPEPEPSMRVAAAVGQFSGGGMSEMLGAAAMLPEGPNDVYSTARWAWIGYLWLLCGSAYFFIRCLFDLALVQRPALAPNLTFGGMAWLAAALFVCLLAVAFRQPDRNQPAAPQPPVSAGVHSATTPIGREAHVQEVVREWFDAPAWLRRSFAGLCHLAVIVGLVIVAHRHFHDASAGMAAATFYLTVPYTGLYVSQVHHVWPIALIVWALAAYRIPTLSGSLLGLAAGTAYFPALVFPLWASFYWKRGMGRFCVAFVLTAAVCLSALALDLSIKGQLDGSIREVLQQASWQPWKVPTSETQGFWTGIHWAYRIPVFLGYVAFVIATAFWPAPKNLAQVIALSAAVIVGIQFWYADQGGVYVLWYLPLIMLLVFRPNLADRRPDLIVTERDWVFRWRQAILRGCRKLFSMLLPYQEEPARN